MTAQSPPKTPQWHPMTFSDFQGHTVSSRANITEKNTTAFLWWLNFFPPILEHFCPLFIQIAQMGLILPRWGLICPEYHLQPLFFTHPSQIPFRVCTHTKHSQLHPKTPLFLAWTWKCAKGTTVWAKWTPTGQNVWKMGRTFLEVGQKKYSFQIFKTIC